MKCSLMSHSLLGFVALKLKLASLKSLIYNKLNPRAVHFWKVQHKLTMLKRGKLDGIGTIYFPLYSSCTLTKCFLVILN